MRIFTIVLLICSCIQTMYGQATLKGIVKSDSNEAIPYANIYIKGTKTGSETKEDGSFILKNIPLSTYTLTASAVGFFSFISKNKGNWRYQEPSIYIKI